MKKPKVLAIDDEEVIGYLLQRAGSCMGFDVDWVLDGKAALKKMEEEAYDVILSDFCLPQMSGELLYQAIAEKKPDLLSRIIFMTGDALDHGVVYFYQRFHVPFLYKPFDVDELHRMITQIVEGRIGNPMVPETGGGFKGAFSIESGSP